MKLKTENKYVERIMKLIHDMADDKEIEHALRDVLRDVYSRGADNEYRREHRWP